MPKIVDHAAHRAALARQAITLFQAESFHGLGMRQVAQALGVSKSALYHYFPTKQALFEACTAEIVKDLDAAAQEVRTLSEAAEAPPAMVLLQGMFEESAGTFGAEMALLFDYTRGKTPAEIAADPAMQTAERAFHTLFRAMVGAERADAIYALIMGALLRGHFSGGAAGFATIEPVLRQVLGKE